MRAGLFSSAAVIAAISGTALGQTAVWNNASGGLWNNASNWDTGSVPDAPSAVAFLPDLGSYTAELNINATLNALQVLGVDTMLDIRGSETLTMSSSGAVLNNGTIRINSTAQALDSRLVFDGGAGSISGTGNIVLGAASETGQFNDARLEAGAGTTLNIGSGQTITGNGTVGRVGDGLTVLLGKIAPDDPLGPGIRMSGTFVMSLSGEVDLTNGPVEIANGSFLQDGLIISSGSGFSADVAGGLVTVTDMIFGGPVSIRGGSNTLSLIGPVTNNSTLTINSTSQVFNATLRFDESTGIAGNGEIVMVTAGTLNDAQIRVSDGFNATIAQPVRGSGLVSGSLTMTDTMTATDIGADLEIQDDVSGFGVGTLFAEDGARLVFTSANVSNMVFDTNGTGIVAATAGETFVNSITNLGNAGIAGGSARLSLAGDITNSGIIAINFDDRVFNAVLDFEATASIDGAGSITMATSGERNDAQIVTSNGSVGTFGPAQTISGSGSISGDFVNLGIIDGDDPGESLRLSGTMAGPGVLNSTGGRLEFANLDLSDQILSSSSGGLVTAAAGASVMVNAVNTGDLGINGNSVRLSVAGGFTNDGSVLINVNDQVFNAVLGVNTETPVGGTGAIVLETSGSLGDARIETENGIAATFGPGQSISGSGQIIGDVAVQGSIDPAGDRRELNAQGGTLALGGTSVFDLGGLAGTEFDRITTGANQVVSLGGGVDVKLDPDYAPAFGDEWEIIGGAGSTVIEGAFDLYDLPPAPPSLVYRVFIEPDRVFVRLTCGADFNGDAIGNFFDISTYISLFNEGDPRADLAAPFGALNFFDIATYIGIFNAGCN